MCLMNVKSLNVSITLTANFVIAVAPILQVLQLHYYTQTLIRFAVCTSCTTNPQQIEVVEFSPNSVTSICCGLVIGAGIIATIKKQLPAYLVTKCNFNYSLIDLIYMWLCILSL